MILENVSEKAFNIVMDWAKGGVLAAYPATHLPRFANWQFKGRVMATDQKAALEKARLGLWSVHQNELPV